MEALNRGWVSDFPNQLMMLMQAPKSTSEAANQGVGSLNVCVFPFSVKAEGIKGISELVSSHAVKSEENSHQYFRCSSRFVKFMAPCLNFGLFDLQAVSGYQIKEETSTDGIKRAECLVWVPSYARSLGLLEETRWACLSWLIFINIFLFIYVCFFT